MTAITEEIRRDAYLTREQLNIVVVGHVDHGKSSLIGRLLADTGSLPDGKLDQVRAMCERNARPFEYAFLLDALKAEQAQGITIDAARCFFKTAKRDYIVHDAPGHIEFLKNMVTGAARAEAALLLIDAKEGIRENSKRHGYIVSMLGIRQLAVVVNKMDLVGYSQEVFESIRKEYLDFLGRLQVRPLSIIPVSAREGENLIAASSEMSWYQGPSVLEQIEAFERPEPASRSAFRMPVQDIYKFTEEGDDRRIVAGTIESGTLHTGDEVIFLPSGKRSRVKTVEAFASTEKSQASAGEAAGFTLTTQVYAKPGELLCRVDEAPARVGTRFRANVFWMGGAPMISGRPYKLKLSASRVRVDLAQVLNVLDASELSAIEGKSQIERHDVAECILETARPVAFDLFGEVERTGRFVIVDQYEIAGCGVILEQLEEGPSILKEQVQQREFAWGKGLVTSAERQARFRHQGKFVAVIGQDGEREIARALEQSLFEKWCNVYYLEIANLFGQSGRSTSGDPLQHEDQIRRLGEMAHLMTDAGLIFITTLSDPDQYDLATLRLLNKPNDVFVVEVDDGGEPRAGVSLRLPRGISCTEAVHAIEAELNAQNVLQDYVI